MNVEKVKKIDALQSGAELIDLINNGAKVPVLVTGSSMLPFLKNERDTVWLTKGEKLRRGQILFFRRSNGMFVLHRIRRIYSDGSILVNGDAQAWCEIVYPEQVIAVVCAISRNGKNRNTDHFIIKIRDCLWYPTRPVRPFIFRVYGMIRKIFE